MTTIQGYPFLCAFKASHRQVVAEAIIITEQGGLNVITQALSTRLQEQLIVCRNVAYAKEKYRLTGLSNLYGMACELIDCHRTVTHSHYASKLACLQADLHFYGVCEGNWEEEVKTTESAIKDTCSKMGLSNVQTETAITGNPIG